MILHGDCLEQLKKLEDNSVDSVVTDPPYGLAFMNKVWDYDVPKTEIWREVLRVLKPGGHLLSFGGTRTYHRMVVAIEDAGFEIRDQIQWLYGSGFPKSHNLDGAHEGWGTALKPANEPIVLARKRLEAKLTVAANVLKWGTGALNIDASRIGYQSDNDFESAKGGNKGSSNRSMGGWGLAKAIPQSEKIKREGRWPANVLLDEVAAEQLDAMSIAGGIHSADKARSGSKNGASRFFYVAKASKRERFVYLSCDCETVKPGAWQRQDQNQNEQTATTSPRRAISEKTSAANLNSVTSSFGKQPTGRSPKECKSTTSTGTTKTTDSKTSNSSRRQSTSVCTLAANFEAKSGSSRARSVKNSNQSKSSTGTYLQKDGRSTGVAVHATLAESLKKSVCEDCGASPRAEGHPTQKPVRLMEYLIRLVTPQGGTVLDPFMGSGTTGVAARKLGCKFIGCEMSKEYIEIAKRRIKAA